MHLADAQIHNAPNPSVVLTGPGQVEIHDVAIPEPSEGEVLVKSHRSLISSGTELTMLTAKVPKDCAWAQKIQYPRLLGYSNVGVVIAVGKGVDPDLIGKRVHTHGAHQAFTVASTAKLARVPEGVNDESATFATLATVAMNAFRRGQVTWGESVGVIGLGVLGQLLSRLSVLIGARPVVGIDILGSRIAKLERHDSVYGFDGRATELVSRVRSVNRDRLLDVVVEASGNPQAVAEATALLRIQGRMIIAGSPNGPTSFDFHDGCNRNSFSIIGAHGFSHPPAETFNTPWSAASHASLFMRFVKGGEFRVQDLISHRIPGAEATDAYARLREDTNGTMGMILDWNA